jgi:hypothetical protein
MWNRLETLGLKKSPWRDIFPNGRLGFLPKFSVDPSRAASNCAGSFSVLVLLESIVKSDSSER